MQSKSKQMDIDVFKENLLAAVESIPLFRENRVGKAVKFIISVDKESDKNHNSSDDLMRLGTLLFSEDINNKEFELDSIINMLVHPRRYFPLWADVSIHEIKSDSIIIKVKTSSRFRRSSELHNKDTNHPPFKVVY